MSRILEMFDKISPRLIGIHRWSVGLNIWNSGSVPVETLKVRLVEAALKPWQISARRNNDDDNLTTDNGQPQPVSWHEDEIARQLPLAPSRRMHLTLHVRAPSPTLIHNDQGLAFIYLDRWIWLVWERGRLRAVE